MQKQDLFEKPQYLTVEDLSKIYDCGTSSALRIMRTIKAYSNIAGIKGKVTLRDYELWINQTRTTP